MFVWLCNTHTKCPVASTWNSALYGAIKHVPHICSFGYVTHTPNVPLQARGTVPYRAIKHVPHICSFGYVKINEITYICQSN